MFTIHCPALPHTKINSDYLCCAYSQKIAKFARMMHVRGHRVFVYAPEGSNPPCAEMVSVLTTREQESFFGPHTPDKAYDVNWDPNAEHWRLFNGRIIDAIRKRSNPGDIISCAMGCQKPIADALPDLFAVETGIGYLGSFCQYPPCTLPVRRCFESYAILHTVRATDGRDLDGSPMDCVIPNYFDILDFPFSAEKKDYFLYVGRLTRRKGLQIAVETTRKIGAKLVIAGQGAMDWRPGQLTTREECYRGDHLDFVGPVNVERRGWLMAEAKALFLPTQYFEPFGGTAVEAQLCGTPVITTDHGVFNETVEQGKTGFRCRIMSQFLEAAKRLETLDPHYICERARSLYSLDAVAKQFEDYFATFAA